VSHIKALAVASNLAQVTCAMKVPNSIADLQL